MKFTSFFQKLKSGAKFLLLVFKHLTTLQKLVFGTLIIILFSFIVYIFLGSNSLFRYYAVYQESSKYEQKLENEEAENAQLKNKINLIKTNSPDYVDEILKSKFNKGNDSVRILKDE